MAYFRSRLGVVTAKVETTEGTDVTPGNDDYSFRPYNLRFEPNVGYYKHDAQSAQLSGFPGTSGTRLARVSFSVDLSGAVTSAAYAAGNPAEADVLLRACGLAVTYSGTTPNEIATYDPTSTSVPSLSMYVFVDGMQHKMLGCRGSAKFRAVIGEFVHADFEFLGVYSGGKAASFAATMPTATTGKYPVQTPPTVFGSSQMTFYGQGVICRSLEIDLGNRLEARPNMNGADGGVSCVIAQRNPTGACRYEVDGVAGSDAEAKLTSNGLGAVVLGPIGATNYNNVKLLCGTSSLQVTGVGFAEDAGVQVYDARFELNRTSVLAGNDEFQIVYS